LNAFITFEGPDGCGKSTQAKLLAEHLEGEGLDVLFTREPGGTEIGDQVRETLMSLSNKGMDPRTEFLLFSASRAQLVQQVILPQLEAGGMVVCDRYYHSSLAYQGYGHQLSLDALKAITAFATRGLHPDLVFLLDLPVEVGLNRRQKSGSWNRLDAYDLAFHQRAREGYHQLAAAEAERWVILDAALPVDELQSEIRAELYRRLN
jgi:dTMP kinase